MPELAEVEFYRKRWHRVLVGAPIVRVAAHPQARVFDSAPHARKMARALTRAVCVDSAAAAKQMSFRFSSGAWLGVHLMFLVGFRNKLSVLIQWTYSYFSYKRGARIITGVSGEKSAGSA